MNRSRILALAVCSVLITACDRPSDQPTPAPAQTEADANAPVTAQEPAAAATSEIPENINPAVVLEATPNPLGLCDGSKLGTVEVKWDVSAAAPSNFSIWVSAPSQERKLWVSSKDLIGTQQTGNWVRDQTLFSLVDDKGVVIAATVVTGETCVDAVEADRAAEAPVQ